MQMAREIDGGEQQIADLRRRLLVSARSPIKRGLDLVGFFADFAQHGVRIVPVEADFAGFCCSFSARVRAGSATGTPASAPSLRAAVARGLSPLRLDALPQALDGLRGVASARRRTHADGGG